MPQTPFLIENLPIFPFLNELPENEIDIRTTLQSPLIKNIVSYPLGSAENNIGQANFQFLQRMGIEDKTHIEYCATPEIDIEEAIKNTTDNTVTFFWSCAVFHRENSLFFNNTHSFPFFCEERMLLDEMQLCIRPELISAYENNELSADWRIASHGAPVPLVKSLPCQILDANSNADAAILCGQGDTQLCITTESGRQFNDLTKLHSFGSPLMVFFAGITERSAKLIIETHKSITQTAEMV